MVWHLPKVNIADPAHTTLKSRPASLSILTMVPSFAYGLPVFWEYPTLTSKPPTAIESFSETGMPANGPFLLIPVSAHVSASGSITSVKQLVFAWALMAILP